jgi:trehalose 2-sulfotransferase
LPPESGHAAAYIICASARSGSTLLCDLLKGTGVAGRPDSFYRQQSLQEWIEHFGIAPGEGVAFERRYLDAVLKQGRGATAMFGMRLMWVSAEELCAKLATLYPDEASDAARFAAAFGTPVYIHLRRIDKVAQAISRVKALQTGLWHAHADGSERERNAPAALPAYDAAHIGEIVAELGANEASWTAWFEAQGIAPLQLTYEKLSADPRGTLARVLTALRLDPALADRAEVRTARLADAENTEWAARFRAERG